MASAIADSLLALLAGAAPAYTNTRARRGQELRETQTGLLGQQRATEEKTKDRAFKEKELAGETDYRNKVLAGQQAEAKATAAYRTSELGLKAEQIKNDQRFADQAQDFQNQVAQMRTQIEGLQNIISVLHARGTGSDKEPKTPEEMYQAAYSKGLEQIFANEDINPERAQERAGILRGQLRELYGLSDVKPGADATDAALIMAQKIAGSNTQGGIYPLGDYPKSPLGGFNNSPSDSDFELNYRANPRLRALVP